MSDTRLRLTTLGGFLGSGKTTWLRHGQIAHIIVNDAAGVAVDDALLPGAAGMTLLSDGCACCDGRAGLITTLQELADRRSQGQPVADVILETSGMADAASILDQRGGC